MTQPRMRKQKRSFRLVASAFVGVIATNEITTIFVEAEAEAEAAEAALKSTASASLDSTINVEHHTLNVPAEFCLSDESDDGTMNLKSKTRSKVINGMSLLWMSQWLMSQPWRETMNDGISKLTCNSTRASMTSCWQRMKMTSAY